MMLERVIKLETRVSELEKSINNFKAEKEKEKEASKELIKETKDIDISESKVALHKHEDILSQSKHINYLGEENRKLKSENSLIIAENELLKANNKSLRKSLSLTNKEKDRLESRLSNEIRHSQKIEEIARVQMAEMQRIHDSIR